MSTFQKISQADRLTLLLLALGFFSIIGSLQLTATYSSYLSGNLVKEFAVVLLSALGGTLLGFEGIKNTHHLSNPILVAAASVLALMTPLSLPLLYWFHGSSIIYIATLLFSTGVLGFSLGLIAAIITARLTSKRRHLFILCCLGGISSSATFSLLSYATKNVFTLSGIFSLITLAATWGILFRSSFKETRSPFLTFPTLLLSTLSAAIFTLSSVFLMKWLEGSLLHIHSL